MESNPHCFSGCLSAFSTNAAGQLDVLGHDCDTLGVDGAKIGVFEKTDKVRLRGFLEGENGSRLESEIVLKVLRNLADEALEGCFAD